MRTSFLGHTIRYTNAVHDRHLLVEDNTLWLGNGGLMRNVIAALDNNVNVHARLMVLMDDSRKQRRSVEWTP